jgi:hypothetical protein
MHMDADFRICCNGQMIRERHKSLPRAPFGTRLIPAIATESLGSRCPNQRQRILCQRGPLQRRRPPQMGRARRALLRALRPPQVQQSRSTTITLATQRSSTLLQMIHEDAPECEVDWLCEHAPMQQV